MVTERDSNVAIQVIHLCYALSVPKTSKTYRAFGFPERNPSYGPVRNPKRRRLTVDDKVGILWGFAHEWPERRIADEMTLTRRRIQWFRGRLMDHPAMVASLPIVRQDGAKRFRCRFCGTTRQTMIGGVRHFLGHVLPPEVARGADLSGIETGIL